ncbi:MAG: glycosyltransferase family 39 protein [Candidatus Omnitrophica bacterium]|nr:glycosyltransferase family 39 protein [Candidatus Omnitrophota bacterium]MBU1128089.1 glycosyltransferase family 39 protein [Candidatus Omnitrophota bacterium]MBU1657263.1 glycosyltransferase family 39 protein [Candidatus Omnitrophota bacterium]MBU1785033.1 glycosyltransferase family 39 protein [Candidatus Omnitrophota bacterium]MBU1851901.1 glycosyltransferase family 39 protein [Candidatus Omnitrophota bacterium]
MKRAAAAILIILVVVSFIGRVNNFKNRNVLSCDEVVYFTLAVQVARDPAAYNTAELYQTGRPEGRKLPPYLNKPLFKHPHFNKPLFKHPPLFTSMIVLSHMLFGTTYNSAFLVSLFFGLLLIITAYFLGAALFDGKTGIYAALIMAIEPVIWISSQKIWMETTLAFFAVLSLCLFAIAVKRYNAVLVIASGVAAGFAALTKYPGALATMIIFIYALCCDRRFFKKKAFIASLFIPFIMLLPWFWWNHAVYGNEMFTANVEVMKAVNGMRRLVGVAWVPALIAAAAAGAAVLIKRKYMDPRGRHFSRTAASFGAIVSICLFCAIIFILRKHIANTCSIFFIPAAGWDMGMFKGEPWYFYMGRLTELSPFYVFSFAAVLFPIFDKKRLKEYSFLLIAAMLTFVPYILWQNYQSRYIASAIVPLVVLSSRVQISLAERAGCIRKEYPRYAATGVLVMIVLYAVMRTLYIDIVLVAPDVACYF